MWRAHWPRNLWPFLLLLLQLNEAVDCRELSCEMLIAIDEPLFVHLGSDIAKASELAQDLVARMNSLYRNTLFRYASGTNVHFRIGEIRVLFDFCTNCNATQIVYLSEFSKIDFSDFCLAHIFTYRDFPEGVQGLAWKSTICHRTYNTGFTTLLNHRVTSSRADSAMTLAHEVGHNLGAEHDETAGCASNYIMSESGSSRANPQFSACSTDAILGHLRALINDPLQNCLQAIPSSEPDLFSFCGDGVVEGREECDCGLHYETCDDPCCYSAHITYSDYFANASATPCRRNRRAICVHPFQSVFMFGLVIPWIVILVSVSILSILLLYDYTNEQRCFKHLQNIQTCKRTTTNNTATNTTTLRTRFCSWFSFGSKPGHLASSTESGNGILDARLPDREGRLLPLNQSASHNNGVSAAPSSHNLLNGAIANASKSNNVRSENVRNEHRIRTRDISGPSNLVSTAAVVRNPNALRPLVSNPDNNANQNRITNRYQMGRTPNSNLDSHNASSLQKSVKTNNATSVKPLRVAPKPIHPQASQSASTRPVTSSFSRANSNFPAQNSNFPPDLDLNGSHASRSTNVRNIRERFEHPPQ